MSKVWVGALGVAMAATAFSGAASAQEVYGKLGVLGVGAGYAYGVNDRLTLRGDVTTIGSYSRNGTSGDMDYRAKLNFATGGNGQAEIDKQLDDINDKARKLRLFPAVYLGASYAF